VEEQPGSVELTNLRRIGLRRRAEERQGNILRKQWL
jgi:hypothetical protein